MSVLEFVPNNRRGDPQFEYGDRWYGVVCDEGDKGRWIALHPDTVEFGEAVLVNANVTGEGKIVIVWYKSVDPLEFLSADDLGAGEVRGISMVPEGAKRFRVELRGYVEGTHTFHDVEIWYPAVEPDPDPDPEPPEEHMLVHTLRSPDLKTQWIVTISNDGLTATSADLPLDPDISENPFIVEILKEPVDLAEIFIDELDSFVSKSKDVFGDILGK